MTSKGPSQKQVIVPMSVENAKYLLESPVFMLLTSTGLLKESSQTSWIQQRVAL